VRAVTVPWRAVWTVFLSRSLPDYIGQTRTAFPGIETQPPLCLGMLTSLVYNRGTSMTDNPAGSGNRAEMRQIRDLLAAGTPAGIPAALRAMARLWPNDAGLRARRAAEATLFAQALPPPTTGA
jgi:hypothetical protein